eukprot:m.92987 g.92987  ORF g.92987 m.92987 type:complete len:1033 (+) comp9982_c0_seq2:72-3170(+)
MSRAPHPLLLRRLERAWHPVVAAAWAHPHRTKTTIIRNSDVHGTGGRDLATHWQHGTRRGSSGKGARDPADAVRPYGHPAARSDADTKTGVSATAPTSSTCGECDSEATPTSGRDGSGGWSVSGGVVSWARSALGWVTGEASTGQSADGATGTRAAGTRGGQPPRGTEDVEGHDHGGARRRRHTSRWASACSLPRQSTGSYIVPSAAMPPGEQYHHHITRMLGERVPKVALAVDVLRDAAARCVTLPPGDHARVLTACLKATQQTPANQAEDSHVEALAQCLCIMAHADVAPDATALTQAVTVLSRAPSSKYATVLVAWALDGSGVSESWPTVSESGVDALVQRAVEDAAWEGNSMGSNDVIETVSTATLDSFRGLVALAWAKAWMRQCGAADPPRAQEVWDVYTALRTGANGQTAFVLFDDMARVLCHGPKVAPVAAGEDDQGESGTGSPFVMDGAAIALDALADALAHPAGMQIPLECQETVLMANARRSHFSRKGRVIRLMVPMAWRHLSSCEPLNARSMVVYRWLVKRLIFESDFEEADRALHAVETKIFNAMDQGIPSDAVGTFGWFVGATITDLAALSARWTGRLGSTDTGTGGGGGATSPSTVSTDQASPTTRALQLFEALERHGIEPNELHYSAAINACAADRPARVSDALALFKKLQAQTDLPQSESAWYAMLKAFAHAQPDGMATEAITFLDTMLAHKEYPSPNRMHYKWALMACLRAKPIRVADACTLLITAPDGMKWGLSGKPFRTVLSVLASEAQRYDMTRMAQPPSREASMERRRLANLSVELIARMQRDGFTPEPYQYEAALTGALDGTLAAGANGLAILKQMSHGGVRPSRRDFLRVLEWCGTASVADEVVVLMRQAGHVVDAQSEAVHLDVLKAYHRSNPPAWEQAVAYLLDLVRSAPRDAPPGPALYQAAIRSCTKANPAQLDGALRLLELMMEQGQRPNLTTLTLLLQCCRRAAPPAPESAMRLWREAADPAQHDPARFDEACHELVAIVGESKAQTLIAEYHEQLAKCVVEE